MFGQENKFSTIKLLDTVIVNKDAATFYVGLQNTFKISDVNSFSYKVSTSGNGLKKINNDTYSYSCTDEKEVTIRIESLSKSKKKLFENHTFIVKSVPRFIANINNTANDGVLLVKKEFFKNAIISLTCDDSNLDFNFKVKKFAIKIQGLTAVIVEK